MAHCVADGFDADRFPEVAEALPTDEAGASVPLSSPCNESCLRKEGAMAVAGAEDKSTTNTCGVCEEIAFNTCEVW